MKKKYDIDQLQEAIEKLNKIMKNETGVFLELVAPIDCPTFDEGTANYVRKRLGLYLRSWVLPKLDEVLNELSR